MELEKHVDTNSDQPNLAVPKSDAGQSEGSKPEGRRIEGSRTVLLMIRHGESLANREQRFTLDDHEPLTDLGELQAKRTGGVLREHYEPTALYASPYHRAHETARIIGAHFSLSPIVVPEIREQSFGEFKGAPYSDFYPQGKERLGLGRWDLKAPGGESLREVAARIAPELETISSRHRGEVVVVVSHGGVMASLRAHVIGHFEQLPRSTENAWGYRLVVEDIDGDAAWRGPLALLGPERAPEPPFGEDLAVPGTQSELDRSTSVT